MPPSYFRQMHWTPLVRPLCIELPLLVICRHTACCWVTAQIPPSSCLRLYMAGNGRAADSWVVSSHRQPCFLFFPFQSVHWYADFVPLVWGLYGASWPVSLPFFTYNLACCGPAHQLILLFVILKLQTFQIFLLY